MKHGLAGAALAATIAVGWIAGAGGAGAASLAGDVFDVSIYYPTSDKLYKDVSHFTDSTAILHSSLDPKGYGRIAPYSITYTFGQAYHFKDVPFEGVVFTDLTAKRIRNAAIGRMSNVTNLSASDLSFTSDTISLNLADVSVQAGSNIQIAISSTATPTMSSRFRTLAAPPPVPLPASAPLFGAALAALGTGSWIVRRRRARLA